MADLNYVSPLTSDLTDYYTKTEVDELQQGDENRFATQAQITAGDNEVKGWVASQGYLTQHQSLANYATKEYVDEAIEDIEVSGGMKIRVVNVLPAEGEEGIFYLVYESNDDEENRYAEYIWSDTLNGYEMLGYGTGEGVMPDLTDYATKSYVDTAVAGITIPDVSDFITERQAYGIAADEAAAQVSILESSLATVAKSGSYNDLTDKPTIPAAPDLTPYATKSELSAKANAADLATVATSGSYNDLSNKPTIPSTSGLASETYVDNAIAAIKGSDIDNDMNWIDEGMAKASAIDEINNNVSAAGLSGSYNDLDDKPTIPTVPTNVSSFTNDAGYLTSHQDISGKANIADLATVATSGSYNDLSNKPTIPSITGLATETYVDNAVAGISVPANTSDLTNDSGFITSSDLPDTSGFVESSDLATVATTGDYDDLTNKPEIDGFDELIRTVFFLNSSYNTSLAERTALTKDELIEWYNQGYIVNLTSTALPLTLTLSDLGCQEQQISITQIQGSNNNSYTIQNTSSSSGIELQSRSRLLKISNNALYVFMPPSGQTLVNFFRYVFKNILYHYSNVSSGLTANTIQDAIDELATSISATPTLATVATSGDYDDLINKPTLFSGDYNDLTNKPTIPSGGGGSSVGWSYDSSTGYMTFTGMLDNNL